MTSNATDGAGATGARTVTDDRPEDGAAAPSQRIALRPLPLIATFTIAIIGFISANLVPFMMAALEGALGINATDSGAILTGCLLATAVACLAVTRLAEGRRRTLVARLGLVVTAIGFGGAAVIPDDAAAGMPAVVIGAVLLGGLGAGAAMASGGAALAAFRTPDRVSAINGFTNRGLVAIILAVIPLVGIGLASAFGFVAALAIVALVLSAWLPRAPLADVSTTVLPVAPVRPLDDTSRRRNTIAGVGLLALFALWAVSEDSLWAMGIQIGTTQAGLTAEQSGLALSVSTAAGLVAALLVAAFGSKLGRAWPMGGAIVLGIVFKLAATFTTSPEIFLWSYIGWNTIYTVGFLYFIATAAALDATGRWSGPALGVYLIGSAFTPLIGAWLTESFGPGGLGIALSALSLLVLVPVVIIAAYSNRVERDAGAAARSARRALNTLEAGAA